MKIDDDPQQDGNLELDEGWWGSVLSDEEAFEIEPDGLNCTPCANSESGQIDWECAKKVFDQDQVVLLKSERLQSWRFIGKRTGYPGICTDIALDRPSVRY